VTDADTGVLAQKLAGVDLSESLSATGNNTLADRGRYTVTIVVVK